MHIADKNYNVTKTLSMSRQMPACVLNLIHSTQCSQNKTQTSHGMK